jgi:hypothetical protein
MKSHESELVVLLTVVGSVVRVRTSLGGRKIREGRVVIRIRFSLDAVGPSMEGWMGLFHPNTKPGDPFAQHPKVYVSLSNTFLCFNFYWNEYKIRANAGGVITILNCLLHGHDNEMTAWLNSHTPSELDSYPPRMIILGMVCFVIAAVAKQVRL